MGFSPLQDPNLNELRKNRIPVTVFLTNGVQLKGTIRNFDQFVIVLDITNPKTKGKKQQQMVYKHAISTLIPQGEFPKKKDDE